MQWNIYNNDQNKAYKKANDLQQQKHMKPTLTKLVLHNKYVWA